MHKANNQEKKKIGIMGGTFNPVHIGHLIIGESVRQEYNLEEVIYIPVGDPPHKPGEAIAEAKHRYNMLARAIEDNINFKLSDIEINRTGKTYTIDTIEELCGIYGEGTDFYFIIGGDTLLEIRGWKRATELFSKCSFIVYKRWGYSDDKIIEEAKDLKERYAAKIFFAYGPIMDISSTQIRESIERGISIKYLVPDKVLNYIKENHIYT